MKLTTTIRATALSVTAAALSLGAAAQSGEQIAFFTKNQTNPFFQVVRLGADNAAKQMGASITHYIPNKPDSIPEQLSQIDDVIIKKPSAVVFTPVDYKAMGAGVQKINAAGIPVVNVTDRSEAGKFVAFVGASDYELGLVTGRYLLKTLGGKGGVVILEGVKGSLVSADRVRGFNDALKEFPQVKLLASQPGNFQRLQGLQVMENLMQTHPQIDGVMAANDAMGTGAIEALEGANRKSLVVGINGTKEAVDAVKAGKMLASGDYNGYLQGCVSTMLAIRELRKLPVPKEVVFKAGVIDKSNYQASDVPVDKRSCPKWEDAIKG
ncbi:sugar ABC transporter substrate-binding protein [Hydrogenophaga sp.]|uniref:sugar ABC transporter substrate-binding protein n=1 Tax=Hydrogenophaga sp. TaxID=1904254 RepID=UPI002730BDC4|nr:sugar ABC transporter substrate-binding protein [Hydrogenophaga sp.]MDP2016044.1 sugar ABC transporter substrate-binding protein [Hydrogenophaga sp.]MDP3167972.1 sugar ABC transporter substrate-binding protein [Hydrogenophaga sp.]MDP3812449.1 sugar ABC transporter substrate-binding protein [Hydrogenophaga sp.]